MKILLFVENNHCGGMDSFFTSLINHWPYPEDQLCLICNESHPGLPNIRKETRRACDFIAHDIPLNWEIIDRRLRFLPFPIRRLFRPILRVALSPYQLYRLRALFRYVKGDRLLVVNGAYPGGESCRLANIAWHQIGGTPGVHRIGNFAIPPRLMLAWYDNMVDRRLDASVHAYIGVSRSCAESLRLRPSLANSKKIHYIYNGVSIPEDGEREQISVDLRERLGIGDAPLCLMLATYEQRKGHSFLFRAFKRVNKEHPDAHLVICGDGTDRERAEVESLRQSLAPCANIHLLGFILGGKKLIHQADMLIVASQVWESFGWTVVEAMVRGVPVVSTNVGGLAEVVGPDGKAGYCVDPDDEERFAVSINKLLANKLRRLEMGEQGRLRVSKLFTIERMVHEHAQLVRHPLIDETKE